MTPENTAPGKWFPEPTEIDDTPAYRGESTTDWLARSTSPRAREARRFLNENLSAFPESGRDAMYRALHVRERSALFELIVARTLQVLGAEIEVEPRSPSGTRVDFLSRFEDGTVAVEAVSPVFNADAGETVKRRTPLLDIIESMAPTGCRAWVLSLPRLGPDDSRKAFKAAVRRLFDLPPPKSGEEPVEVSEDLPEGELRLLVLPKRPGEAGGRAVMVEPPFASWDNSEARIRRAVKRKRRQGRNLGAPSVSAVNATGLSSTLEGFDFALYGREVATVDSRGRVLATRFEPDGEFNRGQGTPTWAAVLAYVNAGMWGSPDPVLYLHPRFRGELPGALMGLERKTYDPETGAMTSREGRDPGFLEELGFASL